MLKDVSSLSKDELMEFVNQTISQGRIAKPEDWIRSWLACHNVQYSYDGMFQVDGIPCALDSLLSYIYVDKVNSDIKKVPKAFIEPAIHKWQEEQRRIYIDQIKSKIIFSGENNLSNSWVKAVTGQENPLDEAVIKHFI